uniref:Ubiquitin-like protein n=2 Tax=Caldiarchaeum subterraneum TaxID=311458 RepID=UPI000DF0CEAC|nr:Chain C, Ubiquitin-like protein [Candidatus Caldarchaeum subterraneum]6FNN_D Chain D, Ubiquitin-like protein [Candidatus Caldarchaeum subterraneum]6FNO_C Chain C, Ubiquitin-like protein [Candidatus Caldarchaeum subterraneum]6FNO_D Chain D, Ubiquitin-like protein [Candidatus Caldarchaeum subterraneum]
MKHHHHHHPMSDYDIPTTENLYFQGHMKIKIVPAVGGGSPLELEVAPNATVGAVRTKVCAMKKLPPDTTRLTYKGRALKDTETLESLGVADGDKFVLITRTVGG